jgi:dTDP-4-dehydrorhamnose reductase
VTKKKRIVVIGANGQLGSRLCERLGSEVIAITRREMRLESDAEILTCLDKHQPDVIINAAAYTNVEKAESEPALAHRINAEAPEAMAYWARAHGASFVHYSTDYVFDGTLDMPYSEVDATNPLNAYGKSKADGERRVLKMFPHALILRISWLYDAQGKNFFTTIAQKLKTSNELHVVEDQQGVPCYAPDIAEATKKLLALPHLPHGIVHCVSQGFTSWYYFAVAIRDAMMDTFAEPLAVIEPVSSNHYASKVTRPKDSRLNPALLTSLTGITLPVWQEGVLRAVQEHYAH